MKNIMTEWFKTKQRSALAAAITDTKQPKPKPALMMYLEPRIMFDGAAVATAIDLTHQDVAVTKDAAVAEKAPVDAPALAPSPQLAEAPPVDMSAGVSSVRHEIIFVDTSVENYQSLLADVSPTAEVVLINPNQDGLQVIADTLAGRSDIDAIHIVSHGDVGKIHLGNDWIDSADVASHADLLATIGQSLSEDGDILLYGCKIGADGAGLDFVQSLAKATHADVATSTDNTGSAQLGGNWVLERNTGSIESGLFASSESLAHYDALLAAPTSETFDGTTPSAGTTGAARVINGWTFSLLGANGSIDAGGVVNVTNDTEQSSLVNGGSDRAAEFLGTYASSGTGQAAAVLAATSGEEFSLQSIVVEQGLSDGNDYRLVGYRDGSAVSGATQNFTAGSYVVGGGTLVTVSGSAWQNLDAVRIVRQGGQTDIGIFVDDITVGAVVRPTATVVVADTALAVGETSLVTFTFSQAVTGFTNGDLSIANGSLSTVTSGDGGITWTATLTPTASTTDSTNVISLNMAGVSAVSTTATGTGTQSSNNYAIDTVRPTASIVVADNDLAVGETSGVTITFSEAVTGFTNADLTIANGTLSAVGSINGGITWTATLTPTASITDTTNVITLANTGVADAAGNAGTGTTNSNNYAIDTARPTATIVVADNALSIGETSLVTITFSEAVSGFDNSALTVANGTLGTVSTSDDITFTATFTPTASVTDATNLITLDNTYVADAAGNAGSGTTNSNNYAIDTVRPTATLVMADTALRVGETSGLTITFSEAVTGFANADLTIPNGSLTAVSSGDGGITWTATFTPTASITDATNLITLANTGVTDAAGNAGTGTTDSNNYAIDTVRPTASIVVADNDLAVGETSGVTITFSEAVTGFTNADLTIANGTLSAVGSINGGITWTATLTPTASITDTTNVITLANTGVADAAGNAGTGTTNSNNYAIDTARPTATIVVADNALSIGETSLVTITFSEAVSGFDNSALTVANGTLGTVSTSDDITFTATFTPTGSVTDATNLITLDNTYVADAAGNSGSGTTNSNNYAIDGVVPTVTSVNSSTSDGVYSVGDTISIQVNFSEAVVVTGTPQLTLETGATDRVVNYASGSGSSSLTFTYTVQAGDASTDLDYQSTIALALNSGTIKDAAGNNGTLTLVSPGAANSLGANRDIALNATPVIGNLNGDSVAWAGVGSTVVLDASSNATASDVELDASNDWSGASLIVQRAGTAISTDTFAFNTSGASFLINGSNIESGGTPFASFTNSGGVLTISFTSVGTTATSALVQELVQRITYRNDTPAGDAIIRFSLSDGSASTTADVTVSTDSIYVTNTTDTATINLTNGVSFSEAIAIAAADVTGSQTIIFDSSLAGQTVSTSSASSLGESVTVDLDSASGVILSGGTLSIGSGFGLTVSNSTSDTASIATTLSGAGNFIKAGAGKATLSGTNSFTGTTTVSAGTLAVSGDGNLGSATVVLNSGATLQVTGSTTIDNAFTLSGSASIQTDSVVTLSGLLSGGAVTLTKTGGSRLTLSNTGNEAAFTGGMTVTAGTLAPTSDDSLGAGVITLNGGALTSTSGSGAVSIDNLFVIGASGGTLAASTQTLTLTGDISGPGTLSKANSQQLTLSGNNTFSGGLTVAGTNGISITDGTNLGSGTVSLNGALFTVTGSGVTIANAIVLNLDSTVSNANAVTFSGGISGGSTLTKAGAGTLTLSGASSGAWSALVTNGTLAISAANNLGSGTLSLDGGALEITGSSFFTLSNNIDLVGAGTIIATGDASLNGDISGAGTLTKTGLALFTLGGNNTYTGATIISAGALVLDVDTALGSTAGGTTVSSGATLQLSEGVTTADALTLSGAGIGVGGAALYSAGNSTISGTVTLAADTSINISNSCTQTLSNVVSGGFGLTKLNLGTLILSNANTYTGATTVSGGTLSVTGSTVSATTVGSGGTLKGTGTVGGAVTVQSGGTLAPGSSGAGTLTLGNGLTIQSGGTLAVDIAGTTAGTGYDVVAVTGTVDVSSATISATHSYTPGSGDTYTIITNNAADAITGTFSGLSEGSTFTAGGNSTVLTASYIGGTGNDFTLTAPNNPVVTSISTVTPDGTYKIGDTITLVVNFSEIIHLSTGTIQLTLETGATDESFSYVSGSGTSSLYFDYVVQAGDHSLDLDYVSTSSLAANGDTIQSGSFIDAILTLPTPGASGSLGANAALVVDGVVPTASIVVADTALKIGETSLVTITFSEAITGLTTGYLTVANGSLSGLGSSDGGITWTATLTPSASITDTTNLITLNNTGVQDIAGNTGTGTTDSNNYAIDTLAPVAPTIAGLTSGTDTGVSSSDGITNNTTPTITGTAEANSTVTIYVDSVSNGTTTADGSGNWSYTFGTALTEATHTVKAAATDAAGNTGSQSSGLTVKIDTTRPTGTVVVADTALKAGETSLVTFTFSEAVTNFTTADITVANGHVSGLSSSDGGITWTCTLTPNASITDTTNVLTLDNTGYQDKAGNAGTGTTNSNNYAVDTLRPTATLVVSDTALATGETSLVTITFNEAVTGFTTADLTVANGVVSNLTTGDGGITWTATFTPSASITDTTNLITLDNTGIQDLSSNAGTGSTDSNNYAIDTLRPTATIVVADTALAAGETSLVTITFSEAISGFTTADLTVANGVVSGLTTGDGGITWTATLTPSASVTDTTNLITLANTGVQDLAGNAGTGSTDSNNYAIDTLRPTATIVVADTALAAGETSLVTLTFSEAVANFDNNDLTVANGTLSNMTTSDGGITWTGTLTPNANITDTTNVITFDSTGVIDGAGNIGAGPIDSNNYAIDTARPTATIVVADNALAIGETSLVTITFSEAVTGFSNADLTIANGTLSSVGSADGGITWTATLTPSASINDTTNLITLANTGVQDAAGNIGSGSTDSNNYAIDTVRPTASIVVSDSALAAGETSLVTITFSEAVTGFNNADLTIANGTLTAVGSVDGGITWTATLTPTSNIIDTTNLVTLANTGVQDLAGNAGTGSIDSNNYAIDTLRPTATIVVADTALAAGETSLVTITFSEAVSNFNNGDLSVSNGSLSNVSSSDGGITWTATLTPNTNLTDTTNLITLANTGVTDAAGNTGTGTTDSNNYAIDTLRPTAIIQVADSALAIGETSLVTITFNEAVTGLTNADLTIANGTLSAVSSADGGTTWTATFTPTAGITDSTNVITLADSGVTDAAGNTGSGTTDSNNYTVDSVRPTASIVIADTSLIAGETSAVTITFSEAVTSFTNADLTIANGTLSAVSSSDGGVTWTATFTPTANINATANLITLANTGVQDLAGNTGTGTTDSNNYQIDTLVPTVSSVSVPVGVTYNTGDVLTFTVNTSETVLVNTAGGTPRIALDIGGTAAYATYVAGSNTNTLVFQYTVKAGDNDANGISLVGLSANSGTLRDAAGNNLNIALNNVGSTTALNIDTVAPTFTSQVQGSPNSYDQGVNFVVNFSEAVDHVDVTDFSLVTTENAKATLSGFQQINDHSWLIAVTDISGNGTVRVDVKAANDITDTAGNALSGSLTGGGEFAAQPLPALPIPPTPAPLTTSPIDAPTPTQAVAPLIVLSPDATSIGGTTNTTPLTTVEAPALATIVNSSLTVTGTSTTPTSLDTSTPGTDPIGVATATNSGTPNPQSGLVHLASGGNQTTGGPASGPTIDRINTAQDSGLQNLPVVGTVNAQTGVPLYIPLPNTQSSDINQQLIVDVRLINGKPLMSWLHFDPVTGSLTGQAPKGFEGKIQIQINVRDSKGNSSSSIMELNFNGERGQSGERDNKPAPTKTKPGAQLMGKPGLNEQFALYGKGAHQVEADALLSVLNQLSIAPTNAHAPAIAQKA